jgi:DNA polymerase epsilon subunit 1
MACLLLTLGCDQSSYNHHHEFPSQQCRDDFEYNPKPDFPGPFEVFNEDDEEALLRRFFDHIQELKPLIQVTYNGDFFDWPFVETRAAHHGMNMYKETGFQKDDAGEYKSRYAPHMDAFRWVQRDSYLPVGSQGLKAVTKAKLRYDPVEIHYEDICRMAAEEPQELCNYSVSDAVATYYLYQKYVHPFIFALCTIIPLSPDDVLRKGSGTLCEALLMYAAYHGNIVMPNKQQAQYDTMHDGHLLDTQTYVGGHVEALEAGVFRNDIPMGFRIVPEAIQQLIDGLDEALKYAITVEEKRDFSTITNYEEERDKVKAQLEELRDTPYRKEVPLIYHLDVAAMYPNIILTNRLQPMAMVDEADCAACEFNKPDAKCQREMDWTWRGELVPASKGEYEMIKAQLESEQFPGEYEGDPMRPFHHIDKATRAEMIKKRLKTYSQKVYKKSKTTVVEDRKSTICQRENPFYITTVENFRDRRYVYKRLLKSSQLELPALEKKGDPAEIKDLKGLIVLYDSLQLAHKCILNSFYGYVMRKGARWYSLEMAGIVCLTGANIITKAREIVEQIGRPLELDTDGIWCCLPGSFPETISFKTTDSGKAAKLNVSYPGAMLNVMVYDHFTNDQYQMLTDTETLEYEVSTINSIFFEVDGPYKAMILPASKEKDKKLKKRYAVYDLDGSLAELKGFEIKRNGELKLIKVFQGGVFDSFLEGSTLPEIYEAVAKCANHWLDIMYSRGADLTDKELFELIGENRSMSRTLEEYGTQKSTSISTAKRLAEFLGDEMVKDKGLACNFIISKKPEGAPVTDRAVPIAIFHTDDAVKQFYLKKWLKVPGTASFDLRDILDWDYYVERLNSAIMKIITIPAALQQVPNPVPRVRHPDWLQKRLLEKKDPFKQQKISSMFVKGAKLEPGAQLQAALEANPLSSSENDDDEPMDAMDLEDFGGHGGARSKIKAIPRVTKHKRGMKPKGKGKAAPSRDEIPDVAIDWRKELGAHPARTETGWIDYVKAKWKIQRGERRRLRSLGISASSLKGKGSNMGAYLARQSMQITQKHWEIVQVAETEEPGVMRLWALVNGDLHCMKLHCYRRFFVNLRNNEPPAMSSRRVNRALPRAHPCLNLCEFNMKEREFIDQQRQFSSYFTHPDVEGVYETQVPLLWRAVVELGCVCAVNPTVAKKRGSSRDVFTLPDLDFKTTAECSYLQTTTIRRIHLHHNTLGNRGMFGLFFPETGKSHIFIVDPGRNDQMPSLGKIWRELYQQHAAQSGDEGVLAPEKYSFEHQVFQSVESAVRPIHQLLLKYSEERHGPTMLITQSPLRATTLAALVPSVNEFPTVAAPTNTKDAAYPQLNWQQYAAKRLLQANTLIEQWYAQQVEVARYSHVPVGNLPAETSTFVSDVFFARALKKQNHCLWVSPTARPDLGGREDDDNRLVSDMDEDASIEINEPGFYSNVCIEFSLDNLAVNAVLQSNHINDAEGGEAGFDSITTTSLDDMMGSGIKSNLTSFDESAQCTPVFRVLKSLVHTWLHEVMNYENEHADVQLMGFYRWLKSQDAMLHDPALHRYVRYLMKKLFMQVIGEFRRLGAHIIHATFTKIVIGTQKTNTRDARKYADYVLKCIKAKPLFQTMQIEPVQFWEQLIWMDRSNYGAVKEFQMPTRRAQKRRKTTIQESSDEDDEMEGDAKEKEAGYTTPDDLDEEELASQLGTQPEIDVDMHWSIMDYLPEKMCQEHFHMVVGEWLYKDCLERMQARHQRGGAGRTPVKARGAAAAAKALAEPEESSSSRLIKTYVTDRLMQVVPKIDRAMPGDAAVDHADDFPKLAGSHLKLHRPALELVKTCVQVFGLDDTATESVSQLRKNLLRLLKVREFSKDAAFVDPCLSLDLVEVVCSFCNHVHELDFARNKNLTEGVYKCYECENDFDLNSIEHHLIENVQRQSMAFQLQDLCCGKCHMIKEDNCSPYCVCSGEFNHTISDKEFATKMATMQKVATFHDLPMLNDELEWIMSSGQMAVA